MRLDVGIRGRIAATAAIATVALLSLVGAVGYGLMVDATRESQLGQLNERLDELEQRLDDGEYVLGSRQFNSGVRVIRAGSSLPQPVSQTLRVVREHDDPDIRALVGVVDTQRIDDTFNTIRVALWVSVAIVGLLVGVTGWFVVDRALAPVRRLTHQAEANLASPSFDAVPGNGDDDEIAELARTFNVMLGRLRDADLERRRFVSDASHELRTPLMVLGADAEFALDHPDDEAATEGLAHSVVDQTNRLSDLVDDLLALGALDEPESPGLKTTTLADVLAKSDARSALGDLPAQLHAIAVPDVSRSVANLLSNARQYASEAVEVSVEVDGLTVSFVVDDDGPGVPVDQRELIFTRFYRPDDDRNRSRGGAGLGLAIAKAEVDRAGGTVVVDDASALGGARFTLSVPVRPGDLPER